MYLCIINLKLRTFISFFLKEFKEKKVKSFEKILQVLQFFWNNRSNASTFFFFQMSFYAYEKKVINAKFKWHMKIHRKKRIKEKILGIFKW